MVYILKYIPLFPKSTYVKNLSCMSSKPCTCSRFVHDSDAITDRINASAKAKAMLEKDNAMRADIIKESAAAKAYHGLK